MRHLLYFYLALIICLVTGCQKEISCEGCIINNNPPIAVAGADQLISLPTDSILLDGSASNDPDGNITTWRWTKIAGPASFKINHLDSVKTVAGLLVQGIYQLELKVTDDKGASAKDTVQIKVDAVGTTNQPPVACAGPDKTITLPVNSVILNGSCSTDPNNDITSYLWTKISGPSSVSPANANLVQTQVFHLVEGTYSFQLKATDASGLFSMDTVQVIVTNQTNNSNVDIYVAGDNNGMAAYWKNGQLITLSALSNSIARSITVVDNNVYVAGEEGDLFMYGNNRAKYWKNGQEVYLTGPIGASGNSITVVGGDVYVAGWQNSASKKTMAIYWKNSQPVILTDGLTNAEATSIVVNGGNVYVAGYENGVAKYWVNDQPVSLTDGSHEAYANSIAVHNDDVYVAGSEHNGTSHVAKYWKNGQAVTLTNGAAVHAAANSIAVVGTDVYVAGWEGDFINRGGGIGSVAKYWKNMEEVSLTTGYTYAYARSVVIFGSDIYVAGDEGSTILRSKYWKNGQAGVLGGNGNIGSSIIVVPK